MSYGWMSTTVECILIVASALLGRMIVDSVYMSAVGRKGGIRLRWVSRVSPPVYERKNRTDEVDHAQLRCFQLRQPIKWVQPEPRLINKAKLDYRNSSAL